MRATHFCRFCG